MTRKLQAALITLTLLAPVSLLAQAAAAPASSTTKIGVIDFVAAVALSNEGQRDLSLLNTKFQPKQTELQGLSKEVDDLKKQLDAQGPSLNEEARATLVKNLETKQKSLQRSAEDAQADFSNQQNEIFKRIGGKVYATLDKFAKENNYAVIFDVSDQQSPVRWASDATNITKPIVDAYNASSGVPTPPKAAAAAPAAGAKPAATHPATKPN
jgi:outer membrane protein